MIELLTRERDAAIEQAWAALARYKFWMFGYHAARVVQIGSLIQRAGGPRPTNPFRGLVHAARNR